MIITQGSTTIADVDGLRNTNVPGIIVQKSADRFVTTTLQGTSGQTNVTGNPAEGPVTVALDPNARTDVFEFNFAALGSSVVKEMVVPAACTITQVTTLLNASGSATFNVKKCTYANYPGTMTDLTGGNNVVLTSVAKAQDAVLTGWTLALAAGDVIQVTSVSATTSVSGALCLKVVRT